VVDATCTVATGTITVTAPLGAQYTYSIDGTNFQASPTFNTLAPNGYTVTVRKQADVHHQQTLQSIQPLQHHRHQQHQWSMQHVQ
jgi:hypothetical protein